MEIITTKQALRVLVQRANRAEIDEAVLALLEETRTCEEPLAARMLGAKILAQVGHLINGAVSDHVLPIEMQSR